MSDHMTDDEITKTLDTLAAALSFDDAARLRRLGAEVRRLQHELACAQDDNALNASLMRECADDLERWATAMRRDAQPTAVQSMLNDIRRSFRPTAGEDLRADAAVTLRDGKAFAAKRPE